MKTGEVVIISTADWDNPFWTNKQHVAVELARRQLRVLYVDSIGLRRPTASTHDLSRILARLRKGLRPPRQVSSNLWVWSPFAIPFQSSPAVRRLNKAFLTLGLSFWMRVLRMRSSILWTYNPMTTELFDTKKFSRIVYHCVDEITAQPGMPSEQIRAAEEKLLAVIDICFVTSRELLRSRRAICRNTHYFSNVADFSHFAGALEPNLEIPKDLSAISKPIIGFIGAINEYKLDLDLIEFVAENRPDWSLVLIGKVGEGEPSASIDKIRNHPNVHLLGPRDYRVLPSYLKGFDVAILPNAINKYTRAMFPMKFFEYLASGRPVVATDLDALQEYRHVAKLATTPSDFIAGVASALAGDCAALNARLAVAKEQTYEARTDKMLDLLGNPIPSQRPSSGSSASE